MSGSASGAERAVHECADSYAVGGTLPILRLFGFTHLLFLGKGVRGKKEVKKNSPVHFVSLLGLANRARESV